MNEYRIGYLTVMVLGLCLLALMLSACGARSDAEESEQPPVAYESPNTGFEDFGIKDESGELLPERNLPEAEDEQLSTAEQQLIFAPAGATQPGIKPTSFRTCVQGDNAQNCVVPSQKDFVYSFASGSETAKSQYRSAISAARDQLVAQGMESCSTNGCWHFREATSVNDPTITVRIILNESATVSACPGSASDTRSLFCYDGPTRSWSKLSPLSGTYHSWNDDSSPPSLAFDEGEIKYQPLFTPAQKTTRRMNVVKAAVLSFGGKGLMFDSGTDRCSQATLWPPSQPCFIYPADACWMNGFGDEGDQDHISVLGANCGT